MHWFPKIKNYESRIFLYLADIEDHKWGKTILIPHFPIEIQIPNIATNADCRGMGVGTPLSSSTPKWPPTARQWQICPGNCAPLKDMEEVVGLIRAWSSSVDQLHVEFCIFWHFLPLKTLLFSPDLRHSNCPKCRQPLLCLGVYRASRKIQAQFSQPGTSILVRLCEHARDSYMTVSVKSASAWGVTPSSPPPPYANVAKRIQRQGQLSRLTDA